MQTGVNHVVTLLHSLKPWVKYLNKARFVKVNIDEQPAISKAFRVTGVPSFFILEGKKVIRKVVGADLNKLENLLKKELSKYPNITQN